MTTVRSSSAYVSVEAVPADRAGLSVRIADYLELAKPRIAAMVLLTVTVGFTLGSGGTWTFASLASALVGIGLVATASGAFNQLIERHTDALMARTANRPLPTGRLQPLEVVAFGLVCATAGLTLLIAEVNWTTAGLAFLTLALYVAAYTPLKRHTALSTAVGAIPGALPPVLGWTASGAPSVGRRFRCLRSCSCGSSRIFWRSPGSTGTTTARPDCGCCRAELRGGD